MRVARADATPENSKRLRPRRRRQRPRSFFENRRRRRGHKKELRPPCSQYTVPCAMAIDPSHLSIEFTQQIEFFKGSSTCWACALPPSRLPCESPRCPNSLCDAPLPSVCLVTSMKLCAADTPIWSTVSGGPGFSRVNHPTKRQVQIRVWCQDGDVPRTVPLKELEALKYASCYPSICITRF